LDRRHSTIQRSPETILENWYRPVRLKTGRIKELFIGLPKTKERTGVWWKYAVLRMGNRIKVVNGELLKRIAEIYNTSDTTEETIEHIMKVLKVNLSKVRNYIWIAIKI